MRQPNDLFRQAREQCPSQTTLAEPLSRQELAELVNSWIFQQTGDVVELDANYVGKLERGKIRWPCKLYRDAFRAVLHVQADGELGFYGQRRRSATVVDVDRQQFIRTAGAVMALPWLDLFAPNTPTPVPSKITPIEIEQIRSTAKVFSSWDNTHGGGLAREAVFAQLRWSARLLRADCDARLMPSLFTAVAELGKVAGFMAFDAYAHEDGRRAFRFALACAEQAKDWQLRANILTGLARQAVWLNEADAGLTYMELALVRHDRLTATERAMLHTVRARALAKMGRTQECLAAVGSADQAFAHAKPSEDPPWMAFYDHAQHHGDTGHALFDLSIRGRRTQAAQRLAYSVAHHGPTFARSRAISRTKLASLLMVTGDPRNAASIGLAALDSVGSLRSKRATDDLCELHRMAGAHHQIGAVRDLCDRIVEALANK
ncbi:hypothetical protein Rhe02_74670 [Rhizocola hellebori]|uniref:Uncharacterized protein n=1 Tax=Rhizocola hellebori TaxID=1392758 RepID=A0A8J3VK55_9ACTN|nr:hypothetical protein [Rhizocola hellebori]GIH09400.1 hypothetical protein Rhe02_74670 [Rhizocola hellebori]